MATESLRFSETWAIEVKPVAAKCSKPLILLAIQYAID
jgi:isocitrate dehydrogenase